MCAIERLLFHRSIHKLLTCGQSPAYICVDPKAIVWQMPFQQGWCVLNQASVTAWGSCRLQTDYRPCASSEALVSTLWTVASSYNITAASFPNISFYCVMTCQAEKCKHCRLYMRLIMHRSQSASGFTWRARINSWKLQCTTSMATKSVPAAEIQTQEMLAAAWASVVCTVHAWRWKTIKEAQAPSSSSSRGLLV